MQPPPEPGCDDCWTQEQLRAILDDAGFASRIDKSGMLRYTEEFPRQCREALALGKEWKVPEGPVDAIVIAGMGGSAAGGDMLAALAQPRCAVPLVVLRGYEVPGFLGPRTLFVGVSYSGNTEETLAAYALARQRGAKLACLCSGGKLGEMAARDGVPVCAIPGGQPPRSASGYLFLPLLSALAGVGSPAHQPKDEEEALGLLEELSESWGPRTRIQENEPKRLATQAAGKVPVIYGYGLFGPVALRWKNQVNENAKVPAFYNVIPEMNHNEIMGWEGLRHGMGQFIVFTLRDKEEGPRIRKRFEVTQSLIQKKAEVCEVWSRGESPLARMLSLSYLGDFFSCYLALLYSTDPTAIDSINLLKQALASLDT